MIIKHAYIFIVGFPKIDTIDYLSELEDRNIHSVLCESNKLLIFDIKSSGDCSTKTIEFCNFQEYRSDYTILINNSYDLVDIVYVLYKCSLQTNYKEEEIKKYFSNLLNEIEEHYFEDLGGFSYYLNKSQTHYYGIKITDGIKEPDIHGTTLLVWSLSMIFEVLGDPYPKWNIIKP